MTDAQTNSAPEPLILKDVKKKMNEVEKKNIKIKSIKMIGKLKNKKKKKKEREKM